MADTHQLEVFQSQHNFAATEALGQAFAINDRVAMAAALANGADINHRFAIGVSADAPRRTLLYQAVQRRDCALVEWLLERGADPTLVDWDVDIGAAENTDKHWQGGLFTPIEWLNSAYSERDKTGVRQEEYVDLLSLLFRHRCAIPASRIPDTLAWCHQQITAGVDPHRAMNYAISTLVFRDFNAHLHSKTEMSALLNLNMPAEAGYTFGEGLTSFQMLIPRIAALFRLLYQLHYHDAPLPESPQSRAEQLQQLAQECRVQVETLRTYCDAMSIPYYGLPRRHEQQLISSLVEGLINRLQDWEGPYALATGWQIMGERGEVSGHVVYVNLLPRRDRWLLTLDNLNSHPADQMYHERASVQVAGETKYKLHTRVIGQLPKHLLEVNRDYFAALIQGCHPGGIFRSEAIQGFYNLKGDLIGLSDSTDSEATGIT